MDAVTSQGGDVLSLRRLVLTAAVLHDVDVEPADDGCLLPGAPGVKVPWDDVRSAVGRNPVGSRAAARALASWLRLRALVAAEGPRAARPLRQAARALALPAGHSEHPGEGWVLERRPGGALECGVGLAGLLDGTDDVHPLPPGIAQLADVDASGWWPELLEHADDMGRIAAARLRRDSARRQQVLRPVGGVDVPSLLLSPSLRTYLASGDGSGMRALAVPMRTRGWFDLAHIDPAFVGAAWTATDERARAFAVPLLVTADEVALPRQPRR